jgi:hypothetical protein
MKERFSLAKVSSFHYLAERQQRLWIQLLKVRARLYELARKVRLSYRYFFTHFFPSSL